MRLSSLEQGTAHDTQTEQSFHSYCAVLFQWCIATFVYSFINTDEKSNETV